MAVNKRLTQGAAASRQAGPGEFSTNKKPPLAVGVLQKNYTIMEESADEHEADLEQLTSLQKLKQQQALKNKMRQ